MCGTAPKGLQCAELTPCILADHCTNGDALSSEEPFAGARDRRLLDFKHLRPGDHHTGREIRRTSAPENGHVH